MQELRLLEDAVLLKETESLVAAERALTCRMLEFLREIERRMLYADLGYGSLFDFVVKKLGLSEGAAHRRISAMRLVRDIPEANEPLIRGALSLSNASQVHTFFQNQKRANKEMSRSEKQDLIKAVQGLSTRDCERKFYEISPEVLPKESIRVVSPTHTELKIVVEDSFMKKLNLIKDRFPDLSIPEILEQGLERLLQKASPTEKPLATPAPGQIKRFSSGNRNPIPASTKQKVWSRASKCEFQAADGTECGSQRRLEIDHIIPRSLGGTNELGNLRVLCRVHNQSEAIRKIGLKKMRQYLPKTH